MTQTLLPYTYPISLERKERQMVEKNIIIITAAIVLLTFPTFPFFLFFQCEKVVEVMCGPGFPLTLRLENPIQESFSTSSSFGHPVVDTTDAVGYICDKHISPHVPQIMCKMFGYPYGRRLNNVTFTSNNSKVYQL